MKIQQLLGIILTLFLFACGEDKDQVGSDRENDTIVVIHKDEITRPDTVPEKERPGDVSPVKQVDTTRSYSNEIFRKVRVEKADSGKFRAIGQARVFEAAFSYVVEDGHFQLTKGHKMTDAGAPEWGNFDFIFGFDKEPGVSTKPHLILFVYSAKDGSIQNELPVPLPGF